jgi:hypothetical protein
VKYKTSQEDLVKANKQLSDLQTILKNLEQKYEIQISAFENKLRIIDQDSQKQIKLIKVQKKEIDGLRLELIEMNKVSKSKDDKVSQLKEDVDKAKHIMSKKDNSEDVVKQFKIMIDKRDKRINELETQLRQKNN